MTESTATPVAAPAASACQPSPAGRRRELDVLTTLIVFGLMFFHTASIFSGQQLVTKYYSRSYNLQRRGARCSLPSLMVTIVATGSTGLMLASPLRPCERKGHLLLMATSTGQGQQ